MYKHSWSFSFPSFPPLCLLQIHFFKCLKVALCIWLITIFHCLMNDPVAKSSVGSNADIILLLYVWFFFTNIDCTAIGTYINISSCILFIQSTFSHRSLL
jgi:hypothetical protein